MNLKYSGILFVLIVLFEAINAELLTNNSSAAKGATEGPLVVNPATDKPLPEDVKPEAPKPSDVPPKQKEVMPIIPNQNTTTTSTTTPSPSPAPTPAPEKVTWIVRNSTTKTTCIIAEMAMQLNITYPGNTKDQNTAVVKIPETANVTGSCDTANQFMAVSWGPGHSLVINFKANNTVKNFFVSGLSLSINATVLKDAKVEGNNTIWSFANKSAEFTTPLEMSYKCSKAQDLNLESDDPKRTAVLTLKDAQVEAFMNKTKAEFGAAQDCDTFDTPDIVPIAVGCALAILVLVVLVAYLIGRKRSQNRGYLSM